jgi:hypothetical protein
VSNAKESYVTVINDFNKGNKLKVTNTTGRQQKNQPTLRLYPDADDPLCPYAFIKFFCLLCEPDTLQVNLLIYQIKEQKTI